MRTWKSIIGMCLVCTAPALVWASPVRFDGADPGVGPGGARPTSDAAATAFDSAAGALGSLNVINMESLPVGNFATLLMAPGVTATLAGTASDADAGITTAADVKLGYNTTVGGTRYLRVVPQFNGGTASASFAFATPLQAFGVYLTGLGTASGNLFARFNDGSSQAYPIAGSTTGGVQFFGFTDAGRSITSVRMSLENVSGSRDIFGIDDLRWVAVPEPASVLLLLGLGALASRRRLRGVTG